MKKIILTITILTIIFSITVLPIFVKASEGLPGSAIFGYGARIDLNGEYLDKVIKTASNIGLDWIAVNFDWEEMWPDPSLPPKINTLSHIINQAHENDLSVLLSISNPAKWAVTENGPDPQTTANLTLSLVDFFSGKILAVELFPGANTQESWKSSPNVELYLETLKKTQETLNQSGKQIALVTTVTPEPSLPSAMDITDVIFLTDLYKLGGKPYLTILGIRFNKLSGEPMSNPGVHFLRHYEELRAVMLQYDHNFGTIWITGFKLPVNNNNGDPANLAPVSIDEQTNWIEEAYKLMRAQLYIGAAFFDQINPNLNSNNKPQVTLIEVNSNLHPISDRLQHVINDLTPQGQLMNPNNYDQGLVSLKADGNTTFLSILLKKYVRQIDFKLR